MQKAVREMRKTKSFGLEQAMCVGKIRYKTRAKARLALRIIRTGKYGILHCYQCDFCHNWHLGRAWMHWPKTKQVKALELQETQADLVEESLPYVQGMEGRW